MITNKAPWPFVTKATARFLFNNLDQAAVMWFLARKWINCLTLLWQAKWTNLNLKWLNPHILYTVYTRCVNASNICEHLHSLGDNMMWQIEIFFIGITKIIKLQSFWKKWHATDADKYIISGNIWQISNQRRKHSSNICCNIINSLMSVIYFHATMNLGVLNACVTLVPLTWQWYSISQEICTRFLLCCALLWLYIDWFSHIHQAYFTGTVAI